LDYEIIESRGKSVESRLTQKDQELANVRKRLNQLDSRNKQFLESFLGLHDYMTHYLEGKEEKKALQTLQTKLRKLLADPDKLPSSLKMNEQVSN
jgi:hypothetical protein